MVKSNDKLRDEFIAHAIWISRYGTGVANRIIKLLNESDAELTARLLVAMDSLDANSFTVSRLESLLASVREINRSAVQAMYSGLSDELQTLAQHEAGYQLSLFQFAVPDDVQEMHPLIGISPDAVYSATMSRPFQGRLLREWASNLEADRLSRIRNTVRQGFLLGDTTEQIARKVRGHVNKNYRDGALQVSRANAASIVKTAVNHLAATARESFARANDDLIKSKQWLSTLDTRTTAQCRIRDRLKYTLNGKPIGHKVPYLSGPGRIHFCCRSIETYILKSATELGLDVRELSKGTRASMDGQVPEDTTYLEWLARQSPERQDQVLGVERGRMYRSGELKLSDMFTDQGEWITLSKLKSLSDMKNAGKSPSFSLSEAQSVEEIEQGMQGIIADKIQFPAGTSLESAKIAAGAIHDVIERFGLPPVSSFGEIPGTKNTAAGAYYYESRAIHIAPWALQPGEWDLIRKNGTDFDFTSTLPVEKLFTVSEEAADAADGTHFDYAVLQSVAGTVTHEMGHHLYYQYLDEVHDLTEQAYESGWWRSMSYYASDSDRELFAETLALFMLGSEDDHHRINPEILAWLKKNSRT